eukprot:TRINITY_DN1180_c1_g1_i1.p2 TRINITY_DN1180_c1_g1~~TRINITY_DN1180_c1_g1_i1.p2  ORF type:complete len:253 (+),score=52.89 TRINITY_DN1180_c1_g1_i1:46-804(+)
MTNLVVMSQVLAQRTTNLKAPLPEMLRREKALQGRATSANKADFNESRGRLGTMGVNGIDERLVVPELRRCLPVRPVPGVAGRIGVPAFLMPKLPLCNKDIPDNECALAVVDDKVVYNEANLRLSPPDFTKCKHPDLKQPLESGQIRKVKGVTFKCNVPDNSQGEEAAAGAPAAGAEGEGGENEGEEGNPSEVEQASMEGIWQLLGLGLPSAGLLLTPGQLRQVLRAKPSGHKLASKTPGGCCRTPDLREFL